MPAFVNASNVRAYAGVMAINAQDDRWNEAQLGSNIRAASAFLQRRTGRQFEVELGVTKKFTTNGASYLSIPDLQTVTSVTLSGTTLTADESFWLIPDHNQSGVAIGVQFRPFGRGGDYRSFPDWFDTNKDSRLWPGNWGGSDPNDLSITGDWGHDPLPDELLHATAVLAAWMTRRPDALLGGVSVTAQGTEIDLGSIPVEVRAFIEAWKAGESVVST